MMLLGCFIILGSIISVVGNRPTEIIGPNFVRDITTTQIVLTEDFYQQHYYIQVVNSFDTLVRMKDF